MTVATLAKSLYINLITIPAGTPMVTLTTGHRSSPFKTLTAPRLIFLMMHLEESQEASLISMTWLRKTITYKIIKTNKLNKARKYLHWDSPSTMKWFRPTAVATFSFPGHWSNGPMKWKWMASRTTTWTTWWGVVRRTTKKWGSTSKSLGAGPCSARIKFSAPSSFYTLFSWPWLLIWAPTRRTRYRRSTHSNSLVARANLRSTIKYGFPISYNAKCQGKGPKGLEKIPTPA